MKSTRSVSDLPCVPLSYDLYLQLTGILLFYIFRKQFSLAVILICVIISQ